MADLAVYSLFDVSMNIFAPNDRHAAPSSRLGLSDQSVYTEKPAAEPQLSHRCGQALLHLRQPLRSLTRRLRLAVMGNLLLLFVSLHRCHCCHLLRPLYLPRICLADFLVIKMSFAFPLLLLSLIVISAYLLFHAIWLTFPSGSRHPACLHSTVQVSVVANSLGLSTLFIATVALSPSVLFKVPNLTICAITGRGRPTAMKDYQNAPLLPSTLHSASAAFGGKRSSFITQYLNDLAAFMTAFAKVSLSPTGGIFSVDTARIIGLAISTMANFSFISTTFLVVQESTEHVKTWLSTVLATAPNRISGGVLTSPELKAFEAYQDVLKFLPLFLVAALVSVVASLILSCLHLIILGGWILELVKALILSLSAGLAADPCIHLTLAISRSNGNEDASYKHRCQRALAIVGLAVTSAALNTTLA
uniref:Uncharacterized protein n=1 Tax=Echinococcus granulosus TaxID=6210 RepID=A0A068X420_ECHGR|nr:hypothetical protein EgrG_002004000 [Echinococcus granulosus]